MGFSMSTLTRLGTSILVRALTIRISSIPQRNMSGDQSTSSVNLGDMRKPYKAGHEVFLESSLEAKEPFAQFKSWFDQACVTPGILEANAMSLATATKDGKPSARYVLLKGYGGKEGFRFFTNYSSRKGKELEENPYAALTFYWEPLLRSIRIEGTVKKISSEESEEYFRSRPKGSQIGASVSPQSQVIESRHVFTENEERLLKEFSAENAVVPRPENWGGFSVIPEMVEFWQGQSTDCTTG